MSKKTPSQIQGILSDINTSMPEVIAHIPESEFKSNYLPLLTNIFGADPSRLDLRPWIARVGGHNRQAHIVSDSNHEVILFTTPPYYPRITVYPSAVPVDEVTKAKRNEKVDPNAHLKATNRIFNDQSKLVIHDTNVRSRWDEIFARYGIVFKDSTLTPPSEQEDMDVNWG